MSKRLTILIGISGVALLGIIVLQFTWIAGMYKERRRAFDENVTDAINAMVVRTFFALDEAPGSHISENMGKAFGEALRILPPKNNKGIEVAINTPKQVVFKNIKVRVAPDGTPIYRKEDSAAIMESQKTLDEKLSDYKKVLQEELLKRKIQLPFELSFSRKSDTIFTTKDITFFDCADYKSKPGNTHIGPAKGSLQVAILNVNTSLLGNMFWYLFFCGLLIIACILSFLYLIHFSLTQKKLSDIREDFINNVTHELKTPISSIKIALENIGSQKFDNTKVRSERSRLMLSEVNRLNTLVEKVLNSAAYDNKKPHINYEFFEAGELMQSVIESNSLSIEKVNAKIQLAIYPLNLRLYGDRNELHCMFSNLIDNALKYNVSFHPLVEIYITADKAETIINVKDNGIGIPAKYQNRVFDKFFRVPTGNLHKIKGHGLGLSIVKAIIELHRGSITIDIDSGKGTAFTIKLPAKD